MKTNALIIVVALWSIPAWGATPAEKMAQKIRQRLAAHYEREHEKLDDEISHLARQKGQGKEIKALKIQLKRLEKDKPLLDEVVAGTKPVPLDWIKSAPVMDAIAFGVVPRFKVIQVTGPEEFHGELPQDEDQRIIFRGHDTSGLVDGKTYKFDGKGAWVRDGTETYKTALGGSKTVPVITYIPEQLFKETAAVLFLKDKVPPNAVAKKDEQKKSEKAEPKEPKKLEYRVVVTSGKTKSVVIDPAFCNEEDMRALGDKLRKDFGKEKIAIVTVFDNEKAAKMYKQVIDDTLKQQEEAFYNNHLIGMYNRNANTGNHKFQINLKGLDGPSIDIDYAK